MQSDGNIFNLVRVGRNSIGGGHEPTISIIAILPNRELSAVRAGHRKQAQFKKIIVKDSRIHVPSAKAEERRMQRISSARAGIIFG